MPCKILHFDNCQMTKLGFRQIASEYSHIDFTINYENSNNESISKVLTQHNPDILVINLDTIPYKIVSLIINYNTKNLKKIKTILVSNFISKQVFESFYTKGILGFLYLNSKKIEIISCIKKVCEKKIYISNEFREKINQYKDDHYFIKSSFKTLTPKEIQVIKFIILGKTSSEIGEILHNSKRTIETHRQHIAEKFDIMGQGRLSLFLIEYKSLITALLNEQIEISGYS
ncbi:LuxR C-terminal-related transcriptional regulator [Aquimarina aggregata]|nr:LuxR C-terminal-related transcriptional regulator [Aquimarina aggregata]